MEFADLGGSMTLGDRARCLLREPLVHFLLAGLAVFVIATLRGDSNAPADRTIVIDEERVTHLVEGWQQTWQRPPTQAEIDGLIADYVKEEIYNREARRLGLDQDDPIIRRRLRSKMEFLKGAEAESEKPDDVTLRKWLDQYPSRFATGATYSFDQIYLGSLEAGQADTKARALKQELAAGKNWHALGEPIMLPASREAAERGAIARDFGEPFTVTLGKAGTSEWVGPVVSGYGQHLIRVRAVSIPVTPKLADVRAAVESDWRAGTAKDREAKAYQSLLGQYTISIAAPR